MNPITIQCVYGQDHCRHIEECLIPGLSRSTTWPIRLITINYDPLSPDRISSGTRHGIEVHDIRNDSHEITGLAKNHNTLFTRSNPKDYFVIIAPSCIPHKGCVELLIDRKLKEEGPIGILEGRQWPYQYSKEYDPQSLHTPWASRNFALIDAKFYRSVGGMDEMYFMGLEDIDLSWQAWLNGYSVLHEPTSVISYFSGAKSHRKDILSLEQLLTLRNYIIIMKKFFGNNGEEKAINMIKDLQDPELEEAVICEYETTFKNLIIEKYQNITHKLVKMIDILELITPRNL